jgi:hypothetical protein
MSATFAVRFPIAFDAWYRALSSALFLPPSGAYVEVAGERVTVAMGWAFSAAFPRSAIVKVTPLARAPLSRGVHGFAGRWLVNGSGNGVLCLDLEPTQRARVLGVRVRLSQLLVSVTEPSALADRLRCG